MKTSALIYQEVLKCLISRRTSKSFAVWWRAVSLR